MPSLGGAHHLRTSNKKLFDELAQDTAPTVEIANVQIAATDVERMWYCNVCKKNYRAAIKGVISTKG